MSQVTGPASRRGLFGISSSSIEVCHGRGLRLVRASGLLAGLDDVVGSDLAFLAQMTQLKRILPTVLTLVKVTMMRGLHLMQV